MACQLGRAWGAAPEGVAATDMSACLPEAGWPRLSRDGRLEGSQPPCGWSDVAGSLNPYPSYYRTAFACSLLLYPQPRRRALRFAVPCHPLDRRGRLRAYHVPSLLRCGLG